MKHRQRVTCVIIPADVIESEDKETLNLRAELLLLLHTLWWGEAVRSSSCWRPAQI